MEKHQQAVRREDQLNSFKNEGLVTDGSHAYLGARNFNEVGADTQRSHLSENEAFISRNNIIKEEGSDDMRPDSPMLPHDS